MNAFIWAEADPNLVPVPMIKAKKKGYVVVKDEC